MLLLKRLMRKKRTRSKKTLAIRALKICFALAALGIISAGALFFYYAKDLPRPERLTEATFAQPTKVYDRTGEVLLYEIHGEVRRNPLPLQSIPQTLQKAVIATEDARFYQHFRIDPSGIMRAFFANIRHGEIVQGGSTITQQLARTAFLSREETIGRKVKEAIITLELERRYEKNEILEFYLNQVPLGPNIYGVGTAAATYFDKEPAELTLAESATIAALIRAPSYYSPYGPHAEDLLSRKDFVLRRMEAEGYITNEEMAKAQQEELVFQDFSPGGIKAPHFVLEVLDQLFTRYGEEYVRESGLKVYTSLDWTLQKSAEAAVARYTERNALFGAHNESLVAIDPQKGELLAMVGSKDWFAESSPKGCTPGEDCLFDPKVNIATKYPGRQPGSSFKPFVYATAFKNGYNDTTTVVDEETNFGVWGGKEYIPQNYDGMFRGEITLREALAQSLNIPAIKVLLDFAGIQESIGTAKTLGITTLNRPLSDYGPSLVLGGGEVRLLDMVSAYGVFAMEGKRTPVTSILRIENSEGKIILEQPKTPATVISPEVANLLTSILSDNEARTPLFGNHSLLYFENYDVAVKTGTTNDFRDAWTIGYIPQSNNQNLPAFAAGVWAGNNNNESMTQQASIMYSTPIWHDFLLEAIPYYSSI